MSKLQNPKPTIRPTPNGLYHYVFILPIALFFFLSFIQILYVEKVGIAFPWPESGWEIKMVIGPSDNVNPYDDRSCPMYD